MSGASTDNAGIPPRREVKAPFFQIGKEVLDVFLPIMGADCLTIYAHFASEVFFDPSLKHNVRDLASTTSLSRSTVSRSLEILEHLRLVKVIRFGGSRDSECRLLDSWVVASCLGAQYDSNTHSYSIPRQTVQRLEAEVKAIRDRQQGKWCKSNFHDSSNACGNHPISVSQRNAVVSPERRQRTTRGTRARSHLIREERTIGNIPTPTPSHDDGEAQKDKSSSDEDELDPLLRWAQIKFTGVMNDLGDHLLDTSRPPTPHLVNGAADWKEFGYNSLAVEATVRQGEVLVLRLSASDPAAARRGLERYRKTWEAALRKWYEGEVDVNVQETSVKR
jgi:DNA-binding transcriptional ArsR family regulator